MTEFSVVPVFWRRVLSTSRILLALSALGLQWIAPQPPTSLVWALLLAYLIYSFIVPFWQRSQHDSTLLLNLILDTILFLLTATYAPENGLWLGAVFYLYLMLTVVLLHQWQQVVLVIGTALSFFLLTQPPHVEQLLPGMFSLGVLAMPLSLQKSAIEERLFNASRQAVLYRVEAEKAHESERQRIAADFHDGPLQIFIGLLTRLEVVRRMIEKDPKAGLQELIELQELWKNQVAELRAFVRSMRPIEVDAASLSASISRLVETFQKDTGISAAFRGGGSLEDGESELAREVLQLVREALHNVRKHSGASRVTVVMEHGDGQLKISIEDNGDGFPYSGSFTLQELDQLRLGPASIKRRVSAVKGDLVLESKPGRGAALKILIPT